MTNAAVIQELTDICTELLRMVRDQQFTLMQFCAEVQEDDALQLQNRLDAITRGRIP